MNSLSKYLFEKFKINKKNIKSELYSIGDKCLCISFYTESVAKQMLKEYDGPLCFIDVIKIVNKENSKDDFSIVYNFLTDFAHVKKDDTPVSMKDISKEEDKDKTKYPFYVISNMACEFIIDEETSSEIIDKLSDEKEIDFFNTLEYTPSDFHNYKGKKFKFAVSHKNVHGEVRFMNDEDWKTIKNALKR